MGLILSCGGPFFMLQLVFLPDTFHVAFFTGSRHVVFGTSTGYMNEFNSGNVGVKVDS